MKATASLNEMTFTVLTLGQEGKVWQDWAANMLNAQLNPDSIIAQGPHLVIVGGEYSHEQISKAFGDRMPEIMAMGVELKVVVGKKSLPFEIPD